MKPLLIIPPASVRWPMLHDLLGHKGQPWLRDIQQRLVQGVPGAQDVYAVVAAGSQALASACVNKSGPLGVLGHCYTRPEHRRRGYARRLVEAVLSWFDMTGGQWLYLGTTAELDEGLYRKFGFQPLRRTAWTPYDRVTLVRRGPRAAEHPYADLSGAVVVRDVTRADWPAAVALLQYRPGPDPRVFLDESAVTAEVFTLDLIDHFERGACCLKGAFCGPRLVGLATVATEPRGERTYGMLIPHTDAPPELRAAAAEFARGRGYTHVDYPMDGLREPAAAAPDATGGTEAEPPATPPATAAGEPAPEASDTPPCPS